MRGGDSARSVFRRSVKNVYWTTTAFVPLSIVWAVVIVLMNGNGYWMRTHVDWLEFAIILGAVRLTVPLVVRALLVGAPLCRPADGPAFAPREPRCDECGYLIVGLPLTSPCPECGLPVRDSLPGGRRKPTDWQQSELSGRGFIDLVRTQWASCGSRLLQHLPVQQGLGRPPFLVGDLHADSVRAAHRDPHLPH